MSDIKNLWGTLPIMTLPIMDDIRTPYNILWEQALLLEKLTDGKLIGNVERYPIIYNRLMIKLVITVPLIDYAYEYVVTTLKYPPLNLYPVIHGDTVCKNEEELLISLEQVLTSLTIRRVIENLLRQVSEIINQGKLV